MSSPADLTWAQIDLKAVAHNIFELRRITDPASKVMAVVKANGYGHGAERVAYTALKSGVDALGVARIDEGISLRRVGFDAPILIFGHTQAAFAAKVLEYGLTVTVHSLESAEEMSEAARSIGKKIPVHLKIDTGMGRIGLLWESEETVSQIIDMVRLPNLEAEGIYTHFAAADSRDKTSANAQFSRFTDLLNLLAQKGVAFNIRHAANSAALIDMPETHLDMVRPGISIYGFYPSEEVNEEKLRLQPAMTLKTRIVQLKKVSAGFPVSYGSTYVAPKPTTIASLPVGYADGLNRRLSSRGEMLVRGMRAPIAGRVCMDQTMLDVGHIPDVAVGDEVVIIGRQGDEEMHADEIANLLDTINYEVTSTVMVRVPRRFQE